MASFVIGTNIDINEQFSLTVALVKFCLDTNDKQRYYSLAPDNLRHFFIQLNRVRK